MIHCREETITINVYLFLKFYFMQGVLKFNLVVFGGLKGLGQKKKKFVTNVV